MAKQLLNGQSMVSATGETGTNTSSAIALKGAVDGYSIVSKLTEEVATLGGTAYLQMSHDGTTFVTISGTTATIAGTGNHVWVVSDPHYSYVRIVHAITSGTAGIATTIQTFGDPA